ncbi:hypothetical Protein YC6258_03315 [Gynuella sunshinyii YC6258]|uniref:Uncharacterized protein n=1 Tax=Gynuella sunshinyii YC6258 TaxID=1445510 RepID=A0A0C5VKZ2_9GAMM|nr:hypothetical Protein YC6258_03315 [Gynuella sunshinyii YC6258]
MIEYAWKLSSKTPFDKKCIEGKTSFRKFLEDDNGYRFFIPA